MEDIVDVGVGVDGALGRGRRLHGPVTITLKAAGPFGCLPSEMVDDSVSHECWYYGLRHGRGYSAGPSPDPEGHCLNSF